jgi:hypothetical protein
MRWLGGTSNPRMGPGTKGGSVPSRDDHEDASALLRHIKEEISDVVDNIETRVLYLIQARGRGSVSPDDAAGELSPLVRDLKRCFRSLARVEEREDLTFKITKDLQEIAQHCLWLFRKLRVQQAFLRKLSQEAKLRSLISEEAFIAYQTVLDLDEEQRTSAASDDAAIHALMVEDTE